LKAGRCQLSPLDRDRLAKVLSRLASSHDGEVMAAAIAAIKYLNASGMTWAEVLKSQKPDKNDQVLHEKLVLLRKSNDRLRTENKTFRHELRHRQKAAEAQPLQILFMALHYVYDIWICCNVRAQLNTNALLSPLCCPDAAVLSMSSAAYIARPQPTVAGLEGANARA
jgi:hypothetical protein